MDLNEFNFPLEESKIARYPSKNRDESKLMIVNRTTEEIVIEPYFRNIEKYLNPGDAIFYNQARVSHRRLFLRLMDSKNSARIQRIHESIFLEKKQNQIWVCLLKNSKKLKTNNILFSPGQTVQFQVIGREGEFTLLQANLPIGEEFFQKEGSIPIPPYLKREAEKLDEERYQTIFASKSGSVASPTAGLHMTHELKEKLQQKGISFYPLLLNIGYGTFQPLNYKNLQEKKLHRETFTIPYTTIQAHFELTKNKKGRRIALGTTTLRALESWGRFLSNPTHNIPVHQTEKKWEEDFEGETDIFIMPGDKIDMIDGLITNFHLPKSSLILLVSAFAGKDLILRAYHLALEKNFRFFSYGDAMLII